MSEEIDVEQIVREYIDKTIHMSLATVSNNKPWVCEVHFAYDDDLNLYWRSQKSRRHSQEIEANPSVAGNIVQQHAVGEYPHAIYFEGNTNIITDENEIKKAAELLSNRMKISSPTDLIKDTQKDDGHKFYKISVENWYAFGKFGGSSGYKYKLEWNGGKR